VRLIKGRMISANVASTPTNDGEWSGEGDGGGGGEREDASIRMISNQLDNCWISSNCMHYRVWNLTVRRLASSVNSLALLEDPSNIE
jgi:hypothetical protein